jgi:aconitate hydratase
LVTLLWLAATDYVVLLGIYLWRLASFGVLTLEFTDRGDYARVQQGDRLVLTGLREAIVAGNDVGTQEDAGGARDEREDDA